MSVFAVWSWKSVSYNAINSYIVVNTLSVLCQWCMSFFNITFVYVIFKWFRYYFLSASVNLLPFVLLFFLYMVSDIIFQVWLYIYWIQRVIDMSRIVYVLTTCTTNLAFLVKQLLIFSYCRQWRLSLSNCVCLSIDVHVTRRTFRLIFPSCVSVYIAQICFWLV